MKEPGKQADSSLLTESLLNKSQIDQGQISGQSQDHIQQKKINRKKQKYMANKGILSGSNIISSLMFFWVSPILTYGNRFMMTQQAIPDLPQHLKCLPNFQKLQESFSNLKKSKTQGLRLLKAIFISFKKYFLLEIVFVLGIVIPLIILPILTNYIIEYIQKDQKQFWTSLKLFLSIMFIVVAYQTSCIHWWYDIQKLSINLANSLALMICKKSLKYPLICCKQYGVSDIINFNQTDLDRLKWFGFNFNCLIITPLHIIIGCTMSFYYIGYAFFPAIGFIILTALLTIVLAKFIQKQNKKLNKAKDKRMKITEEIFNFIRFIKLNNFQKFFSNKVQSKRSQEIMINKKKNVLCAGMQVIYWLNISVMLSLTFATFWLMGEQLTTSKAFTIIVLFKSLQFPIMMLPNCFSEMILAWTSIKRLEKFFNTEEIQTQNIKMIQDQKSQVAIRIKEGYFCWEKSDETKKDQKKQQVQKDSISEESEEDKKQDKGAKKDKKIEKLEVLSDINLQIKKGKLTMIIGDIGSGKSSLLFAILNEMKSEGKYPIQIYGQLAYSSQKPWIMATTIQQNITFSQPYDKQKFQQVLYYSSLKQDIKSLAKGQNTQVGQKGITLSGGQKARISLARAIYSEKDILLLDDILSAVDVHVGEFLIKQTIFKYLNSRNKTVIMPTHAIKNLKFADEIIVMNKGKIVLNGTYSDIKDKNEFLVAIDACQKIQKQEHQKQKIQKKQLKTKLEEQQLLLQVLQRKKSRNKSKQSQQQMLIDDKLKKQNLEEKLIESLIIEQEKQTGKIKTQTFMEMFRMSGGFILFVLIVIFQSLWTGLNALGNIIMAYWCQNIQKLSNEEQKLYLIFFVLVSVLSSFSIFFMVLVLTKQIQTLSGSVHQKTVTSLLSASINQFYNRVPIGRVINRLSKDITQVDESLLDALRDLYILFFLLVGGIFMSVFASTIFTVIPLIFVLYFSWKIKNYYMKTRIQCKRFQSIKNSSVVDGFMTIVYGAQSIRAFSLEQYFLSKQLIKTEQYKKILLVQQALYNWFAMRISLISLFFNMTVIAYCLFSSDSNASHIGLAMTYSYDLSNILIQLIQQQTKVETQLVAIQRLSQFINLKSQKQILNQNENKVEQKANQKQNQNYENNSIELKSVSIKYIQNHPNVLEKVSLKIRKGQKIGIVGRTGAGKSTFFNSLLRVMNSSEGQILINNQNIRSIDLDKLRSKVITIIDQDPVIFHATFRENLDPSEQYSEEDIIKIVNRCGLKDIVDSKGGINSQIRSDSLSIGEKQLICICRALLKKTEIILIDEATANIDIKNDNLIQKIIKQELKESTVLTIAHRITTLEHSDKILVLGNKGILQFDSPQVLLKVENGIYRKMIQKVEDEQDFLS